METKTEHTQEIKYRGFIITVTAIPTRWGICFKAENNYGEPYTNWVGYRTKSEAVNAEKVNLNSMIDQ